MMLGVAVWMLVAHPAGPATLALWAALAFVAGYCLVTMGDRDLRRGPDGRAPRLRRARAGLRRRDAGRRARAAARSAAAARGLRRAGFGAAMQHRLAFKRIKSVADLDRELAAAKAAGRPLMLDFYADWCVSCKEMEDQTFTDPGVQAELAHAVLLQADVTANDDVDQALLARFGILGPPTIVFFGADGTERKDFRVVGFMPADRVSRARGRRRSARELAT